MTEELFLHEAMAPLLIFLISFLLTRSENISVAGAQVPAMFVFGDSLLDPGNNNNMLSLAKADQTPNGIDFPLGTTGRFCNGGTTADYLGTHLGLPFIPPFNNPATKGPAILQGVNYASAGSGILDDTGKVFGQVFTMDAQIQNFKATKQELSLLLVSGTEHITRSLFFIGAGNNDYINNYILPISEERIKYTPEAFSDLLIQQFRRQLTELYNLGARKFLISGIGPLGCTPYQLGYQGDDSGSCVQSTNELALMYNSKLKTMLDEYNADLRDSTVLYLDAYSLGSHIINNYSAYGFKYQNKACCGAGRSKGQIICLAFIPPCQNRSEYVFWDPYHPTDAFNIISAKEAYQGNLQAWFPRNVQQLVQS